jgi:hypothetical protein
MKILLIIPYFGKWPDWYEYFIQSCGENSSISWLLYSDCKELEHYPANVNYVHGTISDFNQLASKKLNLNINIQNPYKICDLRPAFGKIFEDFLDYSDFWGYSDLDLIYGNIENFLTDQILQSFDIISSREEYLPGHFTLFRNMEKINRLYQKCPVYTYIFEDNHHHYAFDEISNFYGKRLYKTNNFKWLQNIYSFIETIKNKVKIKLRFKIPDPLCDMTNITKYVEQQGEIRLFKHNMVRSDLWFKKQGITNWEVIWNKGGLKDITNGQELLHFHIINMKRKSKFKISAWKPNDCFSITNDGIFIR